MNGSIEIHRWKRRPNAYHPRLSFEIPHGRRALWIVPSLRTHNGPSHRTCPLLPLQQHWFLFSRFLLASFLLRPILLRGVPAERADVSRDRPLLPLQADPVPDPAHLSLQQGRQRVSSRALHGGVAPGRVRLHAPHRHRNGGKVAVVSGGLSGEETGVSVLWRVTLCGAFSVGIRTSRCVIGVCS